MEYEVDKGKHNNWRTFGQCHRHIESRVNKMVFLARIKIFSNQDSDFRSRIIKTLPNHLRKCPSLNIKC